MNQLSEQEKAANRWCLWVYEELCDWYRHGCPADEALDIARRAAFERVEKANEADESA